MIEVSKVLRLIRYKLRDIDETRYSDYDIYNALNEALRYISSSQALTNSDFLEKMRIYDASNISSDYSFALEGVKLPEDYLTLVGITRLDGRKLKPTETTNIPTDIEYKITNDRVYTGASAFVISYKKSIPSVDSDTDDIDLPLFCLDAIVKTTCLVLENAETDILMQSVDTITKSIVPRRRYVGAETKMPFFCQVVIYYVSK